MRLDKTRLGILMLALLAALPSFGAQRKRSVTKPNVGVAFTASCKGIVVDAATGLPVAFATVSAGEPVAVATLLGGGQALHAPLLDLFLHPGVEHLAALPDEEAAKVGGRGS